MLKGRKLFSFTLIITFMVSIIFVFGGSIQKVEASENPITMVAYGDVHYYNAQAGLTSSGDTWSATLTSDGTVIGQFDDGNGISDGDYGNLGSTNTRAVRFQGVPEDQSTFRGVDYANGEITTNTISGYHPVPYEINGTLYSVGCNGPGGGYVFQNPVIRKSTDNGKTWTSSSNSASVLNSVFGWPCFIQYGKGGESPSPAVDKSDEYVYMISPSGGEASSDQNCPYALYYRDKYYLARVKVSDLSSLDATKFEYYKSGDGSLDSNWSSNINDRGPIMTDVGLCCMGWVVYNPDLGRYVMSRFLSWTNTPSPFWIYEAEHPWGPWTKIGDQQMETSTTAGLAHFALTNAYMGIGGKKMWAMLATDANSPNYQFHYMPVYLTNQTKTTLQAESGTLLGNATIGSTKTGYTGTGYVTGFNSVGDGVRFTVNASQSGYYIISFRYANTSATEGKVSVYVGGSRKTRTPVTYTEQYWGKWTDKTGVYYLNSGNNTFDVKVASSDSCPSLYIDSLSYAFLQSTDPDPAGTYYQAENATLSGGASTDSSLIDFKGDGCVKIKAANSAVQFAVTTSAKKDYKLFIRYAYGTSMGSTYSNIDLYVNGNKVKDLRIGNTYNNKLETQVELVNLNSGSNTIKLQADSDSGSYMYIDYIKVVDPANIPTPPEEWRPVDDNATNGPTYSAANWNSLTNHSTSWRRTVHYSNTQNANVEFTFRGTGVKWIGAKGPDKGKADIYIDSVLDTSGVDCYAAGTKSMSELYTKTDLTYGTHTIKVVVSGNKNNNSSNTYLECDLFKYTVQDLIWTSVNDNDGSITYGTSSWSYSSACPGYINSDAHYTASNGYYAQFTFTGTGIKWIGGKNNNHGKADVYIDGVLDTSGIDTYAASSTAQQALYTKTGLNSGQHTIKVVVTNSKNASSSGYNQDVDAFEYYPTPTWTTVNDNNGSITFGTSSWSYTTNNTGYINTDAHYTASNGYYAQFTFTGTGIKWIGGKNNNHGKADVYIDGVLDTSGIDTYAASSTPQQELYTKIGLSSGQHTIKVVVTNSKNASSSGYNQDIDAFEYLN